MAAPYECARYTRDSGNISTVTVPVTVAVPAGKTIAIVVGAFAPSAITSFSATDTKGNTWTQRAIRTHATPVNGQMGILTMTATTALATSDTISITANTRTPDKWAVVGIAFDDVINYDTSAVNSGSAGSALAAGPTATAAQNYQILIGGFSYTGTSTWTRGAGTDGGAYATASPGSSPRSVAIQWQTVNASGTRSVASSLSGSQDWTAAVVALNAVEALPLDTPTGFTFTAHGTLTQITADWDDVTDADHYELEVEKYTTSWISLDTFEPTTPPVVLDETDGLEPGMVYRGRVRAIPEGA